MSSLTLSQPQNCKLNLHPLLFGFARLMDFAQVLDKPGNMSEVEVDNRAIAGDWAVLGEEMQSAIDAIKVELKLERKAK
jgi:hypothetical protein